MRSIMPVMEIMDPDSGPGGGLASRSIVTKKDFSSFGYDDMLVVEYLDIIGPGRMSVINLGSADFEGIYCFLLTPDEGNSRHGYISDSEIKKVELGAKHNSLAAKAVGLLLSDKKEAESRLSRILKNLQDLVV